MSTTEVVVDQRRGDARFTRQTPDAEFMHAVVLDYRSCCIKELSTAPFGGKSRSLSVRHRLWSRYGWALSDDTAIRSLGQELAIQPARR
jgi:hypothetical protein